MTRSFTARLRRLWLDVHLWLGVGLLVVLVPLCVTGSILVWHDELDHALYAKRYAVSGPDAALPFAAYAQAAKTAFGDRAQMTQLRLPQKKGDPVVAVGQMPDRNAQGRPRTLNAWIDPPTGRVLATAEIGKTFTMVTHQLHGNLLIPGVGRKIVGWLGWAMFVSSASGLWLWWPRHGGFLKGLRWRRGASTMFNLHHMIGFWICLPLAVLSLTGVYISFPQTSRAVFGLPAPAPRQGGGPGGAGAVALAQTVTSLDAAVAAALAAKPGATVTRINTPMRGKAPVWRVQLKAPGAEGPATVEVVDATGEVKAERRRERPAAEPREGAQRDTISPLMRRIHDGNEMGLVWRIIIFLGGIAPAVLSITGVVMWLRRRARKAAMAAA